MNRSVRRARSGLLAALLLGFVGAVSTAAPASAATVYTRGFDVLNATAQILELVSVRHPGEGDAYLPPIRRIAPGQVYH